MASVRHKANKSDPATIEESLESTILCEYYLWVRWCNIREINGYYIYNGMKGNKLSFVHQQNRKLIIYFHTFCNLHQNESSFTFLSGNNHFTPHSSIPENREEDDNDITFNFVPESPSSSSIRHDTSSPKFNIALPNNSSSNSSTPCSSPPPESPLSKPIMAINPRLSHHDSMDENLHNHWVIKADNDILYYTKDKHEGNHSIDNEYPPSYGWKYNEKNQSSLPKLYQKDNDLMNFGAPPPGITRIPIIPEPMIKTFKNGEEPNVYNHGSFKNGQSHNPHNVPLIPTTFDFPVHFIDIVFKLDDVHDLGFGVRLDSDSKILQINNISTQCMAYKVGLKQADIIIAVNEEDIGCSVDQGLETLHTLCKEGNMMHMTVCRRVFDDIMVLVKNAGNEECNGQYYFHHLDEFDSPVFMQDYGTERMIIRKAHYENETGESLWTISDKTEDYYVGLSMDTMPPNTNWEMVSKTLQSICPPILVFYNKNQKIDRSNGDKTQSTSNSFSKAQLDDVLDRFSHPSESYNDPNMDGMDVTTPIDDGHYRIPSWKRQQNEEDMKRVDDMDSMDWKTKYDVLYETLQDINHTFYEYWLFNKKEKTEIDRLKEIISQHRNRFIIIRKELFQQKRREEDLLDKINSLQTHSRQVSSISALFDDEYHLDIQELQELHKMHIDDDDIPFDNDALDETNVTQKNNRISEKLNEKLNEKLDKIALSTEINELKVQLQAKDVKIRDLEIDINSWQETHSQIYDSFTSATKLYREQLEQFNDEEKFYKEKNNDLETHLQILQKQLNSNKQSRDSVERDKYIDIEAELEYNSDSSSDDVDCDTDDSIGGGTHVRRSSKPWMQIKQKYIKQQRKKEKEKEKEIETITSPPPPKRTESNNNLLSADNPATYLTSLPSNSEANDNDKISEISFLQQESVTSNITIETFSSDDLPLRTDRVISKVDSLKGDDAYEISIISPDPIPESNMPTHPTLHSNKAQSHLSGSMLQLRPKSTELSMILDNRNSVNIDFNEFRESNISILSDIVNIRDSTINIDNVRNIQQQIDIAKEWEFKCNELEIENKDIITSKIELLNNTSKEINKLKQIVNVVLNLSKTNHDIKEVIIKMLKQQNDASFS